MSDDRAALHTGDRVLFEGRAVTVDGIDGDRVRLIDDAGGAQVLPASQVLTAPGFELLEAGVPPARPDPAGLLEALPEAVLGRARQWEQHVVEVQTGLPPGAAADARPRESYDPARRTLAQRDAAKAAELSADGKPVSAVTVKRMRLRYREQGLWGLVDHRGTRAANPYGRVDDRVVAAVTAAMNDGTGEPTGTRTRTRLRHRVEQLLVEQHGAGVVPMPSPATFYRLLTTMDAGRHPSGEATTRRPPANQPEQPDRPGETGVGYGDKLFWLSVVIQRKYAQICAEFDLTPSQATLICAVRNEPRQMNDLAASLGMTKNALSQLVDRTARRDLVGRAGSEQDRRVVMLSATPTGKVLGEAVFAEISQRLPEIARNLDADDRRDFERVATAVVDTTDLSAPTSN